MTRILLLDDSPTIQRAVQLALRGETVQVDWIEDRAALAESFSQGPFDAALVDFHFPETDVYALLQELQTHAPHAQLLLVCGTLDHPEESRLRSFGSVALLRKPFDRKSLLEVLAPTLGGTPSPRVAETTRNVLSSVELTDSVFAELKKPAVPLPAYEVSIDHVQDEPFEIEHHLPRLNPEFVPRPLTRVSAPASVEKVALTSSDWTKVEGLVHEKLRDYCAQWVPQYLARTLRELVQEEMKQMDDDQWTLVLSKALREVVQEHFLSVAEKVIRQELNQLLREETKTADNNP